MEEVIFRPSEHSDLLPIADHMRKCDRDEVYASHGHTPLQALEEGLKGLECYTILLGTCPVAMFGLTETPYPELAGVWFLGTNRVYERKRAFFTLAVDYLNQFNEQFPSLFNIVDIRNYAAIGWATQVGFVIHDVNYYDTYEKRPFALIMRYK
jgi:hypothetical protein